MCKAATRREVVAKLSVVVGSLSCTQEYAPVCASKQVMCIKAPCDPVPTTYSNKCMAEADGASFLYAGACRAAMTNPADDPQCQIWFDGCNTCSRATPGGVAMCTMMACMISPDQTPRAPYCKTYFTGSGNKAPVISSFTGPTVLKPGEQGTWRITASDPENGTLTYDITWGDENGNVLPLVAASNATKAMTQNTTFTHSYLTEGTYTVSITVRDQKGATATASVTVQITATPVACTMDYVPVCGRPTGCVNTCSGTYCAAMCQQPPLTTYSNRCVLDAANATFVHDGACERAGV
jgi:hypothetical protein